MSEFKKKTFGSNRRPGGAGFSRPSFGGARGARDFSTAPELHTATCNKCGNTCEVPFRPNGKKPVYCRDCFVKDDERGERSTSYPRKDFSAERPAFRSQPTNDRAIEALARQLTSLEAKLDVLAGKLDKLVSQETSGPSLNTLIKTATVPKKVRKVVKR